MLKESPANDGVAFWWQESEVRRRSGDYFYVTYWNENFTSRWWKLVAAFSGSLPVCGTHLRLVFSSRKGQLKERI